MSLRPCKPSPVNNTPPFLLLNQTIGVFVVHNELVKATLMTIQFVYIININVIHPKRSTLAHGLWDKLTFYYPLCRLASDVDPGLCAG